MSEYSLISLLEETNKILEDLDPHEVPGAINWGDLRCVDALKMQSVHDTKANFYQVEIEEADPGAWELHEHVSKALAERGFYHVQVVTAW
jgi:hypothetical protein